MKKMERFVTNVEVINKNQTGGVIHLKIKYSFSDNTEEYFYGSYQNSNHDYYDEELYYISEDYQNGNFKQKTILGGSYYNCERDQNFEQGIPYLVAKDIFAGRLVGYDEYGAMVLKTENGTIYHY